MASAPKVRKVVVMGSRGVGKSSLIIQFVNEFYTESYYPTIENTYHKILKYKGQEYDCEVFDTAGQDEFTLLNARYAVGVQGYVLVYSVNERASFDMTKIVRDKILTFFGTDWVPMVLVGNKSDLHGQREVSAEEGQELAKSWRCPAVETSAKNNENIGQVFNTMIEEIEKSLNPTDTSKGGCIIF